mgnify:CR=1 FL=1
MKTNLVRMAVLVVAAATMAAPAFAGENPTDWERQKGNPAEKVDAGTRPTIPDTKDYKYRIGIETGNLPSDAGRDPAVNFPKESDGGG